MCVCTRACLCTNVNDLYFLVQTGGFGYDVPAGRRDGRVSLASEASNNLLPPTSNVNQLTQAFANRGLTQDEMVTLSGMYYQIELKLNAYVV